MHWITRNIDWYSAFSINLGLFFPCKLPCTITASRLAYGWVLDFYLQLFSIDKGISSGLAFYSVSSET